MKDAPSAQEWIARVLELAVARMEAPLFLRLYEAFGQNDAARVAEWNELFLASRETAELRAETVQMGHSLALLLKDLGIELPAIEEPSFPAAFAFAALRWDVAPRDALVAYLWSWVENQVMAAVKGVPLGQTAGQKMLLALGSTLEELAENAMQIRDHEMTNFAPGVAFLSARHETQYSRLFRS